MTRTQVLQEIWQMRFKEAYGGWRARRLTQEEAVRLLGVCERTFRRYVDRYEHEGFDGLVDKRLSQVSARRAPVDEVVRTETLYRERFASGRQRRSRGASRRRPRATASRTGSPSARWTGSSRWSSAGCSRRWPGSRSRARSRSP